MIQFNCTCGQKLKVDDKYAGKKIRCPKCQSAAIVPVSVPTDEDDIFASPGDPTRKMRAVESAEFDFKTLPKLKALDDLVDLEDDDDDDDVAPPPPKTSAVLMKVLGVFCSLAGLSAAIAAAIFLLPQAYEQGRQAAENIRVAPRPEEPQGEGQKNKEAQQAPQ